MALYHRNGIAQHLGNILDRRTLADVPHGARIAQLVRMCRTHSEVGLHFGDLRTLKQILKLDAPEALIRFEFQVTTAERLALWQLVQQRDHTSRKHHDRAFARLPAFVIERAVDNGFGVKQSRIHQCHTRPA